MECPNELPLEAFVMVAKGTYDTREAVAYVHRVAHLSPLDIERALASQSSFLALLGHCCADLAEPGLDLEAERRAHRDLLSRRFVSYDCEAEYVRRKTSLSPLTVTTIIAAETAYKISLGLMESGALPAYREWAAWWVESREHQSA